MASSVPASGWNGYRTVILNDWYCGVLFLNVHVHVLILDGVFARDRCEGVRFHALADLSDLDAAEVLATVEARVRRLIERRGPGERDDSRSGDPWEEAAGDRGIERGVGARDAGAWPGARSTRASRGHEGEGREAPLGPRHARANGFDLHANVRVPAGQWDRLESVCRCTLRPPVAASHVAIHR